MTVRQCVGKDGPVDAIAHLAAVASVPASVSDLCGARVTNFDGTLNLLEAVRAADVRRFLYARFVAVYGDAARPPVSARRRPASAHFLCGRQARWGALSRFLPPTIRPADARLAPFQRLRAALRSSLALPRRDRIFCECLRTGRPATIDGDGHQRRDFVYVVNLANLLVTRRCCQRCLRPTKRSMSAQGGEARYSSCWPSLRRSLRVQSSAAMLRRVPAISGAPVRSDNAAVYALFSTGCDYLPARRFVCAAGHGGPRFPPLDTSAARGC